MRVTSLFYCRPLSPPFANLYSLSLHAKLQENDEAAQLYTKFIAQAETSEVRDCGDIVARR